MVDVLTSFTVTLMYSSYIHREHSIQIDMKLIVLYVMKKGGLLQRMVLYWKERRGISFLSLFESYNA